jgi:hypothetical protein
MAPYRTWSVPDALYRTLVWLDYRLAVLITVGVPLVLLVWASLRREGALVRLMGIYWKLASLLLITTLLLSDKRPLGFVLSIPAQLIVVVGVWFWVDLNEELADLPPWRPLPLTLRVWRWTLTYWGVAGALFNLTALGCINRAQIASARCSAWLQPPIALQKATDSVFDFVLGGDWTTAIAAFVGYVALVAYVVGLLQWLLVRLPKMGRVAGEF